LQGAPEGVTEEAVRELVLSAEVVDVHDYHLWTLDGEHHILTMHVVVGESMDLKKAEVIKEKIKARLKALDISHATIEVEFNPECCGQQSC
ncbi:MAG TPA: cation transporter dimerization domain-containing protein, partial [Chitinophagaceae bacterium]